MKRLDQDGFALPFVRSILRVDEVDSTNDLAKRLLVESSIPVPMLIWADSQTRGRGQRANTWWSDAGSFTGTVILDPSAHRISTETEPMVALATATAVVEAIAERYPKCLAGLRWPNDIEVGGRKLGGILTERVEAPSGPRLLIGIGLNVKTRLDQAPPEVRWLAASLAEWDEQAPSTDPIASILRGILDHFEGSIRSLILDRSELVGRWNHLDTLAGSTIRVELGTEILRGIAAGIDDSGGLRLIQDGQPRLIHAGRVLRD